MRVNGVSEVVVNKGAAEVRVRGLSPSRYHCGFVVKTRKVKLSVFLLN